jgi:mRNA interferase MazF
MVTKKQWCPDRRDVIWIDCSPHVGKEMRDAHPLLVLSGKAFNDRTGIVIGLPMTTAEFNETNPFAIKFAGSKRAVSYILTHQPKSKLLRAKAHPMKQIPEGEFALACESLNQIIAIA